MTEQLDEKNNKEITKNCSRVNIKTWKIVFFSFIAISIIYINCATLASRTPYKDKIHLPVFAPISDLFDLFSVFAYYENINRQFIIQGLPEDSPNTLENWVPLNIVNQYFPYCEGARQMRMYLSRHYAIGQTAHLEGLGKIAAKIREKYNHENPGKKVQKISIGFIYWPRSFQSYKAELKSQSTQLVTLYREV